MWTGSAKAVQRQWTMDGQENAVKRQGFDGPLQLFASNCRGEYSRFSLLAGDRFLLALPFLPPAAAAAAAAEEADSASDDDGSDSDLPDIVD